MNKKFEGMYTLKEKVLSRELKNRKGGVHNRHQQRAFKKLKERKEIEHDLDHYIEEELKENNGSLRGSHIQEPLREMEREGEPPGELG